VGGHGVVVAIVVATREILTNTVRDIIGRA
jgi:hypothetical protein